MSMTPPIRVHGVMLRPPRQAPNYFYPLHIDPIESFAIRQIIDAVFPQLTPVALRVN